ncbi:MAG: UxaA family hydrolase [Chloroflexota bacterium]
MYYFKGYLRTDGRVGVRNHLAVIPTVGCVNEVARKISSMVAGAQPLLHHQGCGQIPPDIERVARVLIGLGTNPNVGAALVVGLGCEGVQPSRVAEAIAATGKPVATVSLQEAGGFSRAVAKGLELAEHLAGSISSLQRTEAPLDQLTIGIKCGASDTTSGLAGNPAVGAAGDRLIELGGTSIFCETTELMGAEHILAARAASPEVASAICGRVRELERNIERFGVDIRGGQPSRGNIAGGISTLEEKSLGAICKAGSAPVQGTLAYGEGPAGKGLFFMDSPGREMEVLAGLAAAGAQVLIFSTGRGAPQGFPVTPVVKVCGNARTCSWLGEHIDVDVSGIIAGDLDLQAAGESILAHVVAVASGKETKAEAIGYTETMEIYVEGPPI